MTRHYCLNCNALQNVYQPADAVNIDQQDSSLDLDVYDVLREATARCAVQTSPSECAGLR